MFPRRRRVVLQERLSTPLRSVTGEEARRHSGIGLRTPNPKMRTPEPKRTIEPSSFSSPQLRKSRPSYTYLSLYAKEGESKEENKDTSAKQTDIYLQSPEKSAKEKEWNITIKENENENEDEDKKEGTKEDKKETKKNNKNKRKIKETKQKKKNSKKQTNKLKEKQEVKEETEKDDEDKENKTPDKNKNKKKESKEKKITGYRTATTPTTKINRNSSTKKIHFN